ncbi:MAG: hypothetical protein HRU27_13075 [Rhizobiaceae bacterium]|nr:hypothetical protein [Hyphomicrobiales bacterium]NRB31518.1 hypothetical protein [Rhizobiaceae bacterium]
MFDTIIGWYDAFWAWADPIIGPLVAYALVTVMVIGSPFAAWNAISVRRRGIPMRAKVIRHIRDNSLSRERTPVYELMPDPKLALLSQYAGLEVKGAVSSSLTLRNIGSVVKVHYVPETKQVISVKDQWLTPIFFLFVWVIGLMLAWGMLFDPTFWKGF